MGFCRTITFSELYTLDFEITDLFAVHEEHHREEKQVENKEYDEEEFGDEEFEHECPRCGVKYN